MSGFEGVLARTFDFEATTTTSAPIAVGSRSGLRLALPSRPLRGPDKYKVLNHRRRQAQIRARHLLDLMDKEGT
jgi:hypothetical protein